MPRPSQTIPSGSQMRFISDRWPWNSLQVSWIVRSGAPESSSCPPGSRVMLAPSFSSAIRSSPSRIRFQPSASATRSSSTAIPRGPW